MVKPDTRRRVSVLNDHPVVKDLSEPGECGSLFTLPPVFFQPQLVQLQTALI
jgi:hypothetical protein